ncbi:MAG: small multi-drug export protein [Thermoplasmata archaeon]|nr:small multi-drug export protein [Thermoplasmata archaeon]
MRMEIEDRTSTEEDPDHRAHEKEKDRDKEEPGGLDGRECGGRIRYILKALALFFIPFGMAALFILILYALLPEEVFWRVGGGMAAYFFPPLGKESVIPILVYSLKTGGYGYGPLEVMGLAGGVVAFTDIVVALFLMWNFDLALKIPLIGPQIKKMEVKGGNYLRKKPWIRRMAFIGVVLFVMFPFQGSGGVGATILGRLIGMKKERVFYAITLGAVLGCYTIAALAYYLGTAVVSLFQSSIFQAIGFAILIVVLGWAAYVFGYKRWNDNGNHGPATYREK